MPTLGSSEALTYDIEEPDAEPSHSDVLENERRLFYVAITRAREQVMIGTVAPPKLGAQLSSGTTRRSRFIEEMRAECTRIIAGGVAQCADRDSVTRYVREAISAYRFDRTLNRAVQHVAGRYLPTLGYPLAGRRMERLLSELPSTEFRYSQPYPDAERPRAMRVVPPPKHEPVLRHVQREDPSATYD
jgi:hypothetical protein